MDGDKLTNGVATIQPQTINDGVHPHQEDTEDEPQKTHRCLGNNCHQMIPKEDRFCKRCKKIKDGIRLSGAEHKASLRQGGRGNKLNNSPAVCDHSSDART